MKNSEIEKSNPFIVADTVDYLPETVVIRTIYKKITGNINVAAFDAGESMKEKISPFDTFIQIIEGQAVILIDGKSHEVVSGESFIIPAHARSTIKANTRFKMLSIVIKSGYEEVS